MNYKMIERKKFIDLLGNNYVNLCEDENGFIIVDVNYETVMENHDVLISRIYRKIKKIPDKVIFNCVDINLAFPNLVEIGNDVSFYCNDCKGQNFIELGKVTSIGDNLHIGFYGVTHMDLWSKKDEFEIKKNRIQMLSKI